MAGVRRGMFTCVGWQVTVCDSIWQVTSHSSEVGFRKSYIGLFYLYRWGDTLQKCLRLRRFKLDWDEMWQDYSSSKYWLHWLTSAGCPLARRVRMTSSARCMHYSSWFIVCMSLLSFYILDALPVTKPTVKATERPWLKVLVLVACNRLTVEQGLYNEFVSIVGFN